MSLERRQEGPDFRRHPGGRLPGVRWLKAVAAVVRAPDHRVLRGAPLVRRADVTALGRGGQVLDGTTIGLGEPIGLGRLRIALDIGEAKRAEVGDRRAVGRDWT